MRTQMWSLVLMKYLQTQNMVALPALVTVIAFFLNIVANAILIPLFGFVVGGDAFPAGQHTV